MSESKSPLALALGAIGVLSLGYRYLRDRKPAPTADTSEHPSLPDGYGMVTLHDLIGSMAHLDCSSGTVPMRNGLFVR